MRKFFMPFCLALFCILNVEAKDVSSVLQKMSPRARKEIGEKILSNQDAFLNDLNKVLSEYGISSKIPENHILFLIDKKHFAGKNYVPRDAVDFSSKDAFNFEKKNLSLRKSAYDSLEEMGYSALDDGIKLFVSSTYRSYEYQKNLFDYWVKVDGLEEAERESARPGTSQHQLGTAVDFGNVDDSFAETKMCRWLMGNAENFGWSLSFPKGYEDMTGYRWECWHFRYIGKTACRFQKKWFNDIQQYMLEFVNYYAES